MHNMAEDDYLWAIQNLRRVFGMFDITTIKTFVVNLEMELLNDFGSCFPFARTLLCRWNIKENITAKMWRRFDPATIIVHMELPGTGSNN